MLLREEKKTALLPMLLSLNYKIIFTQFLGTVLGFKVSQ